MKNIILIGFMGSGKSTLARELSALNGWFVLDSDKIIEQSMGMSVREYFARFGEQAFREQERKFILWVESSVRGAIIATGGGMPIYHSVKEMGFVVHLDASFESICARLSASERESRPLFADIHSAHELFCQRQERYRQQADAFVLHNTNTPAQNAQLLMHYFLDSKTGNIV